jgi:nucleoid-associated protein YgaU
MSACSSLEDIIIEPEMSDLQLTVDTLKTSLRDAQRMVDELRVEVDARGQELAEVQIARAQLEGRIQEAERRLTEARHVIDLQREELSSARSEREQVGRTRAALRKQMRGEVSPAAMVSPRDAQPEPTTILHQQADLRAIPDDGTQVVSGAVIQMSGAFSVGEVPVVSQSAVPLPPYVVVKSGDTLWRIARRYHTSVSRLMVLNALSGDRIQVGQTLWLTEPSADEPEYERM